MSFELFALIACFVFVVVSFINVLLKSSKKQPLGKPILILVIGGLLSYLSYGLYMDSLGLNKDAVPIKKTVDIKSHAESRRSSREQTLKNRLTYLADIPEIEWYEVEGNNVYIGFNKRPDDLFAVVRAAALHGNEAIDFGVHVWAVDSAKKGWRPGDGPYWFETTARHGKIEK